MTPAFDQRLNADYTLLPLKAKAMCAFFCFFLFSVVGITDVINVISHLSELGQFKTLRYEQGCKVNMCGQLSGRVN